LKNYLICAGNGKGQSELTSFDDALKNSGIANYNIVKVSSILPKNAMKREKVEIEEGNVLYTAFSAISSNKKGDVISAAIAAGIPDDNSKTGVIMEYSRNCNKAEAEQKVKEMVREAMANRGYEIKEILLASKEVLCDGNGYVTAIAAIAMW
jgi:arginine decarboxylase